PFLDGHRQCLPMTPFADGPAPRHSSCAYRLLRARRPIPSRRFAGLLTVATTDYPVSGRWGFLPPAISEPIPPFSDGGSLSEGKPCCAHPPSLLAWTTLLTIH